VYVAFLANSSAIYYGPEYGLQRGQYRLGACDRSDTRVYLRDVDQFRGQPRLWVITKGATAFAPADNSTDRYLSTIGVRRDVLISRSGVMEPSTISLYDLSDADRLRRASPASFPVAPMLKYPKPGCRDFGADPLTVVR
jgi:hypothetical protein